MKLRSPGGTKAVGALALMVVAALGWLLVVGPQASALTEVRTQTADALAQTEGLRQQLAVLKTKREQLPHFRRASAALTDRFPATADQPGLFAAVSGAVSDAGIPAENLTALSPTPPVIGSGDETAGLALSNEGAEGTLATQTVTVSVDSTYDQTRKLLGNLEQMPRAYLVTSLTVTAVEDAGFSTTITGDMFVMPVAEDPDVDRLPPARDSTS
jgi:hypothetical protein